MKKIILAIVCVSAIPAMAQSFYVGGAVGRSEQKQSDSGLNLVDNGTGAKVFGGYQIDKNFGVELGYAHLGESSINLEGLVVESKPKALFAAVTGTLPISKEVSAFAKAGVARTKTKMTAAFDGTVFDMFEDKETSLLLGVGASYAINDQLSLTVEYENFGKISKEEGTKVKADLVSFGVRFKF